MSHSSKLHRRAAAFLVVGALVCALLMAFAPIAGAAGTIYVATTGNDTSGDGSATNPYATIQKGIDAAAPGDTVSVAAGTYAESVSIAKSLTLAGAGKALTIIQPTSLADTNMGHKYDADMQVSLFVNGVTGVTVKDLTVDGNELAGHAVVFWNASSGTLENVKMLRPKPFDGTQTGQALAVDATAPGSVDLDVVNCDFEQWNKNAIDIVNGNGATSGGGNVTVDVTGGTFTGRGSTTTIAQNGILLWERGGGTINVSVANAAISGLVYSPASADATGVLSYGSPSGSLSVTGTSFTSVEQYISLATGSDNPVAATGNTFDGVVASGASLAQLFAIEDKIIHATDEAGLGLVRVVAGQVYVTPDSGSIQRGVNVAAAGDVVNVADGTYVEQVTVDGKSLTIQGASLNTVVQAPTTMSACFSTSSAKYPVVCAKNGATLTVDKLTVDGAGRGNSAYQFNGIAFRNSAGTVKNSAIKDISDTPFSGAQHGVALYVYNDDLVSRTVNVWDNSITGFQKNAMALNAGDTTPLSVDVHGNTITGKGVTDITAQNGIQVFAKLATGSVSNNTITGIAYDNTLQTTKWVATSILDYYSSVTISNNIITDAQMGIYKYLARGAISGNIVAVKKAGVSGVGIEATDPPAAVPSPYDAPAEAASMAEAAAVTAVDTVTVSGNTVTFSGPDNDDTVGIQGDAGYGPNDLDITISGNTVTGFNYAVVLGQCEGSCTGTHFVSAKVNNNNLAGNGVGLDTNATITVNAENNWWGSACGPAAGYVVGPVDFAPWWIDASGSGTADSDGSGGLVIPAGASAATQNAIIACGAGKTVTYAGNPAAGGVVVNTNKVTINLNGATIGGGSPAFTIDADEVAIIGPGKLDGWTGTANNASAGVLVLAGADSFRLVDAEITRWADGVQVAGVVDSLAISANFIHHNTDAAVQVDAAPVTNSVVTVSGNLFKDNPVGVRSAAALNAEYNSWGRASGPATGEVVGAVDVDPWTFSEIFFDVDTVTAGEQVERRVNETNPFAVELAAEAQNLYGLSFKFTYDADKLTLGTTVFAAPWVDKCASLPAPAGTVAYRCTLTSGAEWDGGTIATFNFTAKQQVAGNGPWEALFNIAHATADTSSGAKAGVKVFVNNAGFGAPSAAQRDITDANDGKIWIDGLANFTGYVDLQGRTNDSGAVLRVYNQATISGATLMASGTTATGGKYTTAYVNPNQLVINTDYYLVVDRDLYVPTTVATATSWADFKKLDTRPLTSLSTVLLLGGDANNDNVIELGDATVIGGAYGDSVTCPATGACNDVTGDGKVDILDLTLMGGNFYATESPWAP